MYKGSLSIVYDDATQSYFYMCTFEDEDGSKTIESNISAEDLTEAIDSALRVFYALGVSDLDQCVRIFRKDEDGRMSELDTVDMPDGLQESYSPTSYIHPTGAIAKVLVHRVTQELVELDMYPETGFRYSLILRNFGDDSGSSHIESVVLFPTEKEAIRSAIDFCMYSIGVVLYEDHIVCFDPVLDEEGENIIAWSEYDSVNLTEVNEYRESLSEEEKEAFPKGSLTVCDQIMEDFKKNSVSTQNDVDIEFD